MSKSFPYTLGVSKQQNFNIDNKDIRKFLQQSDDNTAVFPQQNGLNQRVFGNKHLPVNQDDTVVNTVSQQLFGSTYPQRYVPCIAPQPQNHRPDEDMLNNLTGHLISEEGAPKTWPYLDTLGKPAVCTGHLINNYSSYPWIIDNSPATSSEIDREAVKLERLIPAQKNGANRLAESYQDETDLRLSEEYCNRLLQQDILSRWLELQQKFPNFNHMSPNMQQALFSAHYQSNILSPKWKNLKKAARSMNQEDICHNLNRDSTTGTGISSRNRRETALCLQGYFIK